MHAHAYASVFSVAWCRGIRISMYPLCAQLQERFVKFHPVRECTADEATSESSSKTGYEFSKALNEFANAPQSVKLKDDLTRSVKHIQYRLDQLGTWKQTIKHHWDADV